MAGINLQYHPEAELELFQAISWYEQKSVGLGYKFFESYLRTIKLISSNYQLFPIDFSDIRKAKLNNFPFCVYYQYKNDQIRVFSVFHNRREPTSWHKRI